MAIASTSSSGEGTAKLGFDGIPPSPLTHINSSKTFYDVFINHRGPDVKRQLANTLYHMLGKLGVNVFLDKHSLQLGDSIPVELEDAMRGASIHIAIFSKNYAQSTWCLKELSFMLKTGTKIIPIFYEVEPSDLRWVAEGTGIYVEAFAELEKKGRENSETLKEWKAALKVVSNFIGYEFKTNGDQGELLNSVVDCVLLEINKKKVPLSVAKHPVGLNEAVLRFEQTVMKSAEGNQAVQFVGIVGVGGSGKTTLAKEIFNRKCSLMEKSSFLFDVRDPEDKYGLCTLQKDLLKDTVGNQKFGFNNINVGKTILATRLKSYRMLLVLDDVDCVKQLDALLPEKESFGHGSLIIVTTRDSGVLLSRGISTILHMEMLNPDFAKQLFCWHAFSQSRSPSEFEDLVQRFVDACYGLPLSLQVFGQMVFGRPKDYWYSQLDKVQRTLPKGIEEVLKVSYDSLERDEKEMFLDAACFFIGEKKSLAIEVWNGAKWSGLHGLTTLVDKCLVELDQHERIRMHHHLSDLGQYIANGSSPSRIWVLEQINNLRKHSEDPKQIRGIKAAKTHFAGISPHQEFPQYSEQYRPPFEECLEVLEISNKEYKRLKISLLLEVLVVAHQHFTEDFKELSRDLVWLRWFDFKSKHLPSWMSLSKLRALDICGALSLEELWMDGASNVPSELRELTIAADTGNSFHTFPRSISLLKCLRKMVLIPRSGDEFGFTSLPEEFCELLELEHLELRCCRELSSLPSRFGELKNLRHLDLCSCHRLRKLPSSFNDLIELKFLDFSECRELTVEQDILKKMVRLEKLLFTGCRKLQWLPCDFTVQKSLKELHLLDTWLREIPSSLDQLSKLETLKIGSPFLTTLPASLYCLPSLTHLSIRECILLRSLPDCIDSSMESKKGLTRLQHLWIECKNLSSLPLLSSCKLNSLQTLEISHCFRISELGLTPGSLNNLKVINLTKASVTSISISNECCPSLETLQLRENDDLVEIKELPPSVKLIELANCRKLREIRCLPALINPILKVSNCPSLRHTT